MRIGATLLILAIWFAFVGCGNTPPPHLVSVSVTPAIADAQNFPDGQVQFTAVGTFDHRPSSITLSPAIWQVSSNTNPVDAASVNQNGVAQCKAGFLGTVTILGGQFQCGPTRTDSCKLITGSAQLTCP
jgi:hypothetical protein